MSSEEKRNILMAARSQTDARRRAGKRLAGLISEYGLELKAVSKATGIDMTTLRNLTKFTPHLGTIEKLALYLEQVARQRAAG